MNLAVNLATSFVRGGAIGMLGLIIACGGAPSPAAAPAPSSGTESGQAPGAAQTTSAAPSASASAAPSTSSEAPAAKPDAGATKSTERPKKIGARHVLIQWMGSERASSQVLRTREQALVIAQEVHRRAKGGEDLGRLAVEYSDEPGAASRGGSLGRFGSGQMVPAFEAAAFTLDVGEISDIVETPFGFHIIQRTE
ncbi:Peptidyl-prolyl cis-trans isomerase PpiD [Labilithrix luteola]|uniref:peptidylprolyl isomerase n=1 Tax=Labilithrix luteola TaxID=1391654 RepID=A0A0K1Q895_9BACT|nr:peptidylprolyl isomerase [Labilithrix luteola]AKV01877.1 Peptidyl-prolyl cis-trans isomerase PpiD [Labilithrix luteola]